MIVKNVRLSLIVRLNSENELNRTLTQFFWFDCVRLPNFPDRIARLLFIPDGELARRLPTILDAGQKFGPVVSRSQVVVTSYGKAHFRDGRLAEKLWGRGWGIC